MLPIGISMFAFRTPTGDAFQARKSSGEFLLVTAKGGFGGSGNGSTLLHSVAFNRSHYSPVPLGRAPRPAVQLFRRETLSTTDLSQLNRLAGVAGLTNKTIDFGPSPAADSRDLLIEYRSRKFVVEGYAVDLRYIPTEFRERRRKLNALLKFLDNRAGQVIKPKTLVALTVTIGTATLASPDTVAWPASSPELGPACQVFTDPKSVELLLQSLSTTQFLSHGYVYRLVARPLVPGDDFCRDVR